MENRMEGQIRAKREHLGWSCEELAFRCGVSAAELARWEDGTSAPSPFDLVRVYAVLTDGLVERLRDGDPQPDSAQTEARI